MDEVDELRLVVSAFLTLRMALMLSLLMRRSTLSLISVLKYCIFSEVVGFVILLHKSVAVL